MLQKIRLAQIKSNLPTTYNNFEQQVDGMNTPKVAVYTATGGETKVDVATAMGSAGNPQFNVGTRQLQVYLNGQFQQEGVSEAYTEDTGAGAGISITFNEALAAGDQVVFRIEGVGSGYMNIQQHQHVWREVPAETPDGVRTEFTLQYVPHTDSEVVFLDGVAMRPGIGNDYTISGNTITFIRTDTEGNPAPPVPDSNIQVNYVR